MPVIKINSCSKTPNNVALEAVASWMLRNYAERNYQEQRTVTVSKQRLSVKELPRDTDSSICSCNFEVEMLESHEPKWGGK